MILKGSGRMDVELRSRARVETTALCLLMVTIHLFWEGKDGNYTESAPSDDLWEEEG